MTSLPDHHAVHLGETVAVDAQDVKAFLQTCDVEALPCAGHLCLAYPPAVEGDQLEETGSCLRFPFHLDVQHAAGGIGVNMVSASFMRTADTGDRHLGIVTLRCLLRVSGAVDGDRVELIIPSCGGLQ